MSTDAATRARAEKRYKKRHPMVNRLALRRHYRSKQAPARAAELQARAAPTTRPQTRDAVPSPREARDCIRDLCRVLGQELTNDLIISDDPMWEVGNSRRLRHIIGWLWIFVYKQPRNLTHLSTFGRFMKPGDGHPINGLEDWSI